MSIGELAYAFFNTPGIGGIVVFAVFGTAAFIYIKLTRWIINGSKKDNNDKDFRFR
jgi:hypothetical protein